MDKIKRSISGLSGGASAADDLEGGNTTSDERGLMEEMWQSSTLSWSTRIQGFAFCFITGTVFSLLGSSLLWAPKGLRMFVVFYTIGNLLSLSSTCFLMGPVNQVKKMFNESRWIASCLVLLFLILTLVSALWLKKYGLALIFCGCEMVAYTWYSLSYIPYARTAVKNCLTKCCGGML